MGAKTMGSLTGGGGGSVQQHNNNNTLMAKEGSLYNLTLNEVENQLSHLNKKPLGSMNLDELLKTVWSAEATQCSSSSVSKPLSVVGSSSSSVPWRQPEFIVSSDLSNKTVDEVWKCIQHKCRKNEVIRKVEEKEQSVLGEMTLEEFLDKAGSVCRESEVDDDRDDFGHRLDWMQYELTPVEQTRTSQQQNQQLTLSISGLIEGHMHQENQLAAAAVIMSPARGTMSETQTPRKKRVATGEVVEKSVERRQKRMIKNRESAARSRARKQAYTNELENKISILEEEIEILKKQQAVVEKEVQCAPPPPEPKIQLRRTYSGPL